MVTKIPFCTKLLFYKILKLFIDAGVNVNELNSNNSTCFSMMADSECSKEEILRQLIEFNCVNLTNKVGQNILTNILKPRERFPVKEFVKQIILEHIAKLVVLNLHVDSSLLHATLSAEDYFAFFTMCKQELELAKTTKLSTTSVTFFNLLVDDKYKLMKHTRSIDLIKDCRSGVRHFPIYRSDMERKIFELYDARILFKAVAKDLNCFLPIFNSTHLIVNDILHALSDEDWKKLCNNKRFKET